METSKNLLQTLENKSLIKLSTSKIENYINGLIISLGSVNKQYVSSFLIDFEKLSRTCDFGLLNKDLFIKIYKSWIYNKNIFQWFEYINSNLSNIDKQTNEFWEPYIQQSIVTENKIQQLYSNVDFIAYLTKLKLINTNLDHENNKLINRILSYNITYSISNHKNLNCLKKENKIIIHWFKKVNTSNNSTTLKNKIYSRYKTDLSIGYQYTKIKKIVDLLDSSLESDYMLFLNKYDFERIAFLYEHKPSLFENLHLHKQKIKSKQELINFFFNDFIIPTIFINRFFFQETYKISKTEMVWFIHVLKGHSFTTISSSPFTISKACALAFLNLEDDHSLSISNLLLSCMLTTNGIDNKQFINTLIKYIEPEDNLNFIVKYLPVFYKNELLTSEIQYLITYLRDQYMQNYSGQKIVFKNFNELIQQSYYYFRLKQFKEKTNHYPFFKYANVDYKYFSLKINDIRYSINVIKNWRSLKLEALSQQHCVESYHRNCSNGSTTIFSMKKSENNSKQINLLTIEVEDNKIIQIRGFKNRPAKPKELEIIAIWAKENNFLMDH